MLLPPSLVPGRERVEALLHGRPVQPVHHRAGPNQEEDAFAAVLDGGVPLRLELDLRALHVRLVLAVDVRRHGVEPGEPDERHHLPQPMELEDGLDAGVASPAPPRSLGQTARVEIGIDRHVLAEALGRREERLELHLLDRALGALAGLLASSRSA
jgi:hypothetical protein